MKLIVGLGNPGSKHEKTRHNLGFMVLDALAHQWGVDGSWFIDQKFRCEVFEVSKLSTMNYKLLLAKPQTYMNLSGLAVKMIVDYFKVAMEDIIVIHDDLDIPLGKIKIRVGGSAGGHHGVESILKSLGDDKFTRVRLGIGTLRSQRSERDRQHVETEEFVLKNFEPSEKSKVKHMVKFAVEALEKMQI